MIPSAASLQSRYSGLTCAVAMIVGDKDQVVDRDQTSRLHSILSHSGIRIVRGAGHMVHHAAPDELIEVVGLITLLKAPGSTNAAEAPKQDLGDQVAGYEQSSADRSGRRVSLAQGAAGPVGPQGPGRQWR